MPSSTPESAPHRYQVVRAAAQIPAWPNHAFPPILRPLTRLIGRDAEIIGILHLLRNGARLITLTGPGGIGKTRLAVELADRLARDDEARVAFIPLETITRPDDVIPTILRLLGVRDRGLDDPVGTLRMIVDQDPVLLVLDNLEQVLGATAQLRDLVTAVPQLSLLVTSRVLLGIPGEHRVVVPPLESSDTGTGEDEDPGEMPAAVQLFVERAVALAPDMTFDPPALRAIGRICRRLDGLPLAVELAAARVTHLSLPELERRLAQRYPLLSRGDALGSHRHRTLWQTVAWSYDLLTPAQRRILRLASVFRGGFTLAAVVAVAGAGAGAGAGSAMEPTPDCRDASGVTGTRSAIGPSPTSAAPDQDPSDLITDELRALVDASLVLVVRTPTGEPRYRVLETVRDFGHELLRESGELAGARRRHAAWFLAFVEELGISQFMGGVHRRLDILEPERDNEIAAGAWFDEAGTTVEASRFVAALAYSWWLRGMWRSAHPRLAMVWGDSDRRSALPTPSRVSIGVALGIIDLSLGYPAEEVLPILRDCVEDAEKADPARPLVVARVVLGFALGELGLPESYEQLFAALDLVRSLGSDFETLSLTGLVHNNLGAALRRSGDFDLASGHLEAGRRLLEQVGNTAALRTNLVDQADLARDAADHTRAWELYVRAIQESELWDDHRLLVGCLEGLVTVMASVGAFEEAGLLVGAHLRIRQTSGYQVPPSHDGTAMSAAIRAGQLALGDDRWRAVVARGQTFRPDDIAAMSLPGRRTGERPVPTPASAVSRSVRPGPEHPADLLSRRELEVLRLVVAGRSNRQIADDLFLSHRTVESHLTRIFGKLGVENRSGAVAVALCSGLVAGGMSWAPGPPAPAG